MISAPRRASALTSPLNSDETSTESHMSCLHGPYSPCETRRTCAAHPRLPHTRSLPPPSQLAREICLHIRIVHPYVVALYAAWKDSKYVYLALEWAPQVRARAFAGGGCGCWCVRRGQGLGASRERSKVGEYGRICSGHRTEGACLFWGSDG